MLTRGDPVHLRRDESPAEPPGMLAKRWDEYVLRLAGATLHTSEFLSVAERGDLASSQSELETTMLEMFDVLEGIESMVVAGYEPFGSGTVMVGIRVVIDAFSVGDMMRLKKGWTLLDRTLGHLIAARASQTPSPNIHSSCGPSSFEMDPPFRAEQTRLHDF